MTLRSRSKISEYFFFENLTIQLPWQPIKINDLDKIHMVCKGLLQASDFQFYTSLGNPDLPPLLLLYM